jgi:hypothetical protein
VRRRPEGTEGGAAATACGTVGRGPGTRAASAPGTEERGGGERSQPCQPRCPVPVGGPPATEPSGAEANLDQLGPPGPHPAHPSSPLGPGGARWCKVSAPCLLDRAAGRDDDDIAQLVLVCLRGAQVVPTMLLVLVAILPS